MTYKYYLVSDEGYGDISYLSEHYGVDEVFDAKDTHDSGEHSCCTYVEVERVSHITQQALTEKLACSWKRWPKGQPSSKVYSHNERQKLLKTLRSEYLPMLLGQLGLTKVGARVSLWGGGSYIKRSNDLYEWSHLC